MAKKSKEVSAKASVSGKVTKEISIGKYFQLHDPPIHKYTRVALDVEYHGIIKLASEWAIELKEYTRGE